MTNKNIRILHVIEGLDVGGAQSVLLGILRLANQDKFPMHVANIAPRTESDLSERVREWCCDLQNVHARALWDVRSVAKLVEIIRRERITVVHTHLAGADIHGGVAAKLARTPVVSTLHSIFDGRRRYKRPRRILFNVANRRLADRLIAVSADVRSSHVQALHLDAKRVDVIPNAPVAPLLLPRAFSAVRKRAELAVGGDPLVCATSNLTDTRDHETLLRALPSVVARFPTLSVVIVGDGSRRNALIQLAQELELDRHVRFLGTRLDAVEILAASDLFCHPTLFEGLPVAVLEAMSLGLPVVASSVPGVRECIPDADSGILVPPRDVDALAGALCSLLASKERRTALGNAAQQRVWTQFDPEQWIRRIEDVYVSLVRRHPRSSARG